MSIDWKRRFVLMDPETAEAVGDVLADTDTHYAALKAAPKGGQVLKKVAGHEVRFLFDRSGFTVHVRAAGAMSLNTVVMDRKAAKLFAWHMGRARAMAAFIDKAVAF